MDKLLIRNLELYAAIGVSQAEREVGQRLVARLELGYDLALAGRSDDLTDTISYAEVVRLVHQLATTIECQLLEFLAERICQAILDAFPVTEVRVRLLKVPPPLNLPIEAAGVEILRRRQ